MPDDKKLKRCPFCGTPSRFRLVGSVGRSNFYIECCVCHSKGPPCHTEEQAITEWNNQKDTTNELDHN